MIEPDFTSFPEINTQRLLLRKLLLTDAPQILKLRSDEQVMQYIDKERAKTISDAEIFINRVSLLLSTNDGITWAIALLAALVCGG
jgi:[ribosomal protein S5]-alanine N-acetyltransferase